MRIGPAPRSPCVAGDHCPGGRRVRGAGEMQRGLGLGLAALHRLHDALDLLMLAGQA